MGAIRMGRMILSSMCLLAFLAAVPAAIDAATKSGSVPAAPGSTRQTRDDFFARPATPQDSALAQTVKARLQPQANVARPKGGGDWRGDKAAAQTRTTGGPDDGEWRSVGVDARNGHVRLTGKGLTAAQRTSVESVVKQTPGVMSWDWGN
jgi:hypothetical protein